MLSSLINAIDYPEIVLLPVLMVADFLLTIEGSKRAALVYRKHFVMPTYEMNPLWRQSVEKAQWLNPRHLALVALTTCMLLFVDVLGEVPWLLEIALGTLFGVWSLLIGRHFTNILLFSFLNRHPDEISGQVSMTLWLNLKFSQFTYLGCVPIFVAVMLAVPNTTTVGMAVGAFLLAGVHSLWIRKARNPGGVEENVA